MKEARAFERGDSPGVSRAGQDPRSTVKLIRRNISIAPKLWAN